MTLWNASEILIIGHRGFMAKYPENTILSFLKAVEMGAHGVELDVWLTKDGLPVVIHDESLERLCGWKKSVKEMKGEDLLHCSIGGEKIPILEDVFHSLPDKCLINVEIKDVDAADAILKVIKENNAEERVLISSFNVDALEKVRKRNPRIPLGLLVKDTNIIPKIPGLASSLSLFSINLPIDAIEIFNLEEYLQVLHWIKGMGLKIALWPGKDEVYYRNNNLAKLKGLFDIVITDDVERMTKYLLGDTFKKF